LNRLYLINLQFNQLIRLATDLRIQCGIKQIYLMANFRQPFNCGFDS
jgi:hypothetical protein